MRREASECLPRSETITKGGFLAGALLLERGGPLSWLDVFSREDDIGSTH